MYAPAYSIAKVELIFDDYLVVAELYTTYVDMSISDENRDYLSGFYEVDSIERIEYYDENGDIVQENDIPLERRVEIDSIIWGKKFDFEGDEI